MRTAHKKHISFSCENISAKTSIFECIVSRKGSHPSQGKTHECIGKATNCNMSNMTEYKNKNMFRQYARRPLTTNISKRPIKSSYLNFADYFPKSIGNSKIMKFESTWRPMKANSHSETATNLIENKIHFLKSLYDTISPTDMRCKEFIVPTTNSINTKLNKRLIGRRRNYSFHRCRQEVKNQQSSLKEYITYKGEILYTK